MFHLCFVMLLDREVPCEALRFPRRTALQVQEYGADEGNPAPQKLLPGDILTGKGLSVQAEECLSWHLMQ